MPAKLARNRLQGGSAAFPGGYVANIPGQVGNAVCSSHASTSVSMSTLLTTTLLWAAGLHPVSAMSLEQGQWSPQHRAELTEPQAYIQRQHLDAQACQKCLSELPLSARLSCTPGVLSHQDLNHTATCFRCLNRQTLGPAPPRVLCQQGTKGSGQAFSFTNHCQTGRAMPCYLPESSAASQSGCAAGTLHMVLAVGLFVYVLTGVLWSM